MGFNSNAIQNKHINKNNNYINRCRIYSNGSKLIIVQKVHNEMQIRSVYMMKSTCMAFFKSSGSSTLMFSR
jgi:hypothetical protein